MMIRLVVTIETILLLLVATLTAKYVEVENDNCVLSFVVPKERMKSSCDTNERFQQKLASADRQMSRLRQEVSSLKVRLTYGMSQSSNQDVTQDIQNKIDNIERITIPNLTQRISAMEQQVTRSSESQRSTEASLISIVNPIIQAQMASLKEQVTREILDSAIFRNIGSQRNKQQEASRDTDTSGDIKQTQNNVYPTTPSQQKDPFGFFQDGTFTKEDPFNSFNFEQFFSKAKTRATESTESSERSSFEKRSLNSKSNRRRIPALDNEFPEESTKLKPLQADQSRRSNSRKRDSYEKPNLHDQMKPIFQQQAAKVQEILAQHMAVINERMARVLTLIQGVQAHYDAKFEELETTRRTDIEGMNVKIENVKQELLTSEENFKQSLFNDPDFLENIDAKHAVLENKITSKLPVLMHPIKSDLATLKSHFQDVNRYQTILETSFQGFRRQSRDILQDIDGNITYLTEQITELSKPKNDSEVDYEFDQQEMDFEYAVLFVEEMKAVWPEVQANFTRIDSKIRTIDTSIASISAGVEKLPKNYTFLQIQINSNKDQIVAIRTSVGDLINESIRRSLDNLEWVRYDFTTAEQRTACDGDKYVKKTSFSTGKFVGVILCSPYRYKIYLTEAIEDPFLDIGDTWRFGEDHCEFVGGSRRHSIKVGQSGHHFDRILGYKRSDWGQTPVIGTLSFFSPTPPWYECGIAIPG